MNQPLDKLVTLLTHARRGAFAIALYDRLSTRRDLTAALRQQLSRPLTEVYLSEKERNPIDLLRAHAPKPGDVICLFDLERAFPEALGYLDFQREVLTDMGVSLVCWVTPFEHRKLAHEAPNFYAFRTAVFDFTTTQASPSPDQQFFGREREKHALATLLQAGGNVVLTGLGGVGKTALAQVVVNELRSHFVGGAIWINCETKPVLEDMVLTATMGLIGDVARQYRPEERRQRLEDTLRDRPCLLVLDNFETVAEDSEILRWLKTKILPSSALVVSRQNLPYLSAPTLRLDELPSDDAVRLFAQRARDAGWDGAGSEITPRLCALVGNLPLALHLLAPRAAELPLAVLEEMVSKNLEALAADKASPQAERQQSIAACFRVSFDRLSEDARTLLIRLSVPPDGLGVDLIESFTDLTAWQQPLAECVRHSLINLEGQRYRFHPLVRRFALMQLGDGTAEWQRRFVNFFSVLAEECEDISHPNKRAILDAEWRNAIAAAAIAEELREWQAVIIVSECLGEFLNLRRMWAEREQLNKRALAAARISRDRAAEGRSLGNLGTVYQLQGRQAEAVTAYEQSLGIFRELRNLPGEGAVLNNLGIVYQVQERWADALTAYEQSLNIAQELKDPLSQGQTLNNMGNIYQLQGKQMEAVTAYEQSLGIFRELRNLPGEGAALNNLGNIYRLQGRWADALTAYEQSLTISQALRDRHSEGETQGNIALLRKAQGDLAGALGMARASLQVLETTEDESAKEKARQLIAQWEQQLHKPKARKTKGRQ